MKLKFRKVKNERNSKNGALSIILKAKTPKPKHDKLTFRLGFLSIESKGGAYALAHSALGRLGYADLQKFALLSGVSRLYPSLENTKYESERNYTKSNRILQAQFIVVNLTLS